MHFNVLNRKVHYWASGIVALPLLIIICTGAVLQLKKHWSWVQPPEQRGTGSAPVLELSHILEAVKKEPRLGVTGWDDVNRLDVRPGRGIVKVWLKSNWEAQIDLGTGEIKQIWFRRSDWIESIHDGSIFGDGVKLWIFFPTALTLLLLWLGGVWMFVYPFLARRRVRRQKLMKQAPPTPRAL
jgi:uncharacterized iron-regulated membrane protein